jgi:hypothetical protein
MIAHRARCRVKDREHIGRSNYSARLCAVSPFGGGHSPLDAMRHAASPRTDGPGIAGLDERTLMNESCIRHLPVHNIRAHSDALPVPDRACLSSGSCAAEEVTNNWLAFQGDVMKKALLVALAGLSLGAGAVAFADKVHDWHDLDKVHTHIQESIHEMERARAANHYDMAGHGAKAEELLRQAEHELHEAIESSKAAH